MLNSSDPAVTPWELWLAFSWTLCCHSQPPWAWETSSLPVHLCPLIYFILDLLACGGCVRHHEKHFKVKMSNTHCSLLVLLISMQPATLLRRNAFPFIDLCSLHLIASSSFIHLQEVSRTSCSITLAGWSICTFLDPHSGSFWKIKVRFFLFQSSGISVSGTMTFQR